MNSLIKSWNVQQSWEGLRLGVGIPSNSIGYALTKTVKEGV